MKPNHILLATFFISVSATAQIQKGSNFLSGGLSGQYSNYETKNNITNTTDKNKYSFWNLNIGYGHYVSNRFALGVNFGITMTETNNSYFSFGSSDAKSESTLYSISPFVRNSKSISDKLYCFIQLNVRYGSGPLKSTNNYLGNEVTESTLTVIGGGITGGLNYFLNDRFALQLTYGDLSYNIATTEIVKSSTGQDNTLTNDNLSLNLGLSSLNIGLQYFIHCSKGKK